MAVAITLSAGLLFVQLATPLRVAHYLTKHQLRVTSTIVRCRYCCIVVTRAVAARKKRTKERVSSLEETRQRLLYNATYTEHAVPRLDPDP